MRPLVKQPSSRAAFTIIELLTVMSVIIILIGLLVPALNMVKRAAKNVTQKNQFHAIDVAMDLFNLEYQEYPPSAAVDDGGSPYCGSMKLCESMVGRDLLGFHRDSRFLGDGTLDGNPANQLYPEDPSLGPNPTQEQIAAYQTNLKARKGPYLQLSQANAYRMSDLYGNTVPFSDAQVVLCDVYSRVENKTTGKLVGMPVLYFRANTSNTSHVYSASDNSRNIYNVDDNLELVRLGMPWMIPPPRGPMHTLGTNAALFYEKTQNERITTSVKPHRPDSYILLSAGFDGEYGSPDDIYNF